MNRYTALERDRMRLTAQVCDLMSSRPDGRAASANGIAALYAALVDILSDELHLAPELLFAAGVIERIRHEREYALFQSEYWKGAAAAERDAEQLETSGSAS
jgi:hypothetical protein